MVHDSFYCVLPVFDWQAYHHFAHALLIVVDHARWGDSVFRELVRYEVLELESADVGSKPDGHFLLREHWGGSKFLRDADFEGLVEDG